MLILHDMINAGDTYAAQEIHTLFRKEDRERERGRMVGKPSLRDQPRKLAKLAENLKIFHNYMAQGVQCTNAFNS